MTRPRNHLCQYMRLLVRQAGVCLIAQGLVVLGEGRIETVFQVLEDLCVKVQA